MLRDGFLTSVRDLDKFESVVTPMVDGLFAAQWHMLDCVAGFAENIMFSSISTLLGNAGQTNYADANGGLDGVMGLPCKSIEWGAWVGVGMAATHGVVDHLRQAGFGVLGCAPGTRCFGNMLERSIGTVA